MTFDFTPHNLLRIPHLRFKRLWLGLGVLMILTIVALSLTSLPGPVGAIMVQDKALHLFAYFCLTGWFAQIFRHDLTRLLLVVLFVMLGIGVEFGQALTPTRAFDTADMVANTCGVVLAWALAYTRVGNVLKIVEHHFCERLLRPDCTPT